MRLRGVAGVLTGVLLLTSGCGEPTMTGLPYSTYTHEDEPFAQQLFAEQASVPVTDDAELLSVAEDYDTEYTHVVDLARRSFDAPGSGPTIWFFGGSALFGVGQRDEHTIPSEIARIGQREGAPVQVVNFGFPAYLSWQEAGLLRRVLAEREPPDLIVMYHGANDLGAICRQLALGVTPDGLGDPLTEAQPEEPEVLCIDDPDATGRLVADAVSRSMEDARDAAGDVPVVEVWQPFAATRRTTSTDGPLLERLGVSEQGRRAQAAPYVAALDHIDPRPADLTDALDDYDGPLFFDWAHTNELGAAMIAEALWDRSLADAVRALD